VTARTVAVVTAGLSVPSSTRLLADRLSTAVVDALAERDVRAEVVDVELRDHAHALMDHLLTGFPSEPLAAAIAAVQDADAVVAVTPVFSASYSGLFKTFFDVVDKDVLTGRPVLLGATAGTARHSLVLDHAMRPLFAYLHAAPVPTGVFAASEDWGSADGESALNARVARAARELADAVAARPPVEATDPLAVPESFSALLRNT
jgi:FMN reductase